MLPPVEDAVLKNNPQFAALYSMLTTTLLNSDGSTRRDGDKAAKEKIHSIRIKAAKDSLLAQAIATATPPDATSGAETRPGIGGIGARRVGGRSTGVGLMGPRRTVSASEVPPELMDLLMLLPALMEEAQRGGGADSVNAEELALILASPPFDRLPELLPRLAALVSERLHTAALGLARVVNPSTNPSFLHRAIPGLPKQVAELQAGTQARGQTGSNETTGQTAAATAQAARQQATTHLLELLDARATALAALLRVLEAKHGAVARSLELRAAEVALAAQAGELEARSVRARTARSVYPDEAVVALQNYASHLRDAKMRLDEELREKMAVLEEYGISAEGEEEEEDGGGEKKGGGQHENKMRELARLYREMSQQVAEAQRDLQRLGR